MFMRTHASGSKHRSPDVTVDSFVNSLFELGEEMFLFGMSLLGMPKFIFNVVNASMTLMSL